MAGVPGSGGPVPKRDDQRRRRNTPAKGQAEKAPGAATVAVPEADPGWHPVAARWFVSLGESGQSVFYEPSDWAQAQVWAEVLSRALRSERVSANLIAAWSSGAGELMTTEGARRRLRLELERPKPDGEADGDVEWIDDARRRLRESG